MTEPSAPGASIDDLLSTGIHNSHQAPREKLTPRGVVVQTLALAAVAAAIVWGIVVATGYAVPFSLLFVVFLAVTVGWRISVMLRPPRAPELATLAHEEPTRGVPDRPFADARRWVDRLDWVRGDAEQFSRTVRPAIAALADEKLRLRHGITRASHPRRAAELLGPRLADFLNSPRLRRAPSPAELSALVTKLEEL